MVPSAVPLLQTRVSPLATAGWSRRMPPGEGMQAGQVVAFDCGDPRGQALVVAVGHHLGEDGDVAGGGVQLRAAGRGPPGGPRYGPGPQPGWPRRRGRRCLARRAADRRAVPSVRVVIFATNSARRPSAVPACDGLQVRYLASAGKPLRTAPYHSAIKQREQGRRRA